METNSYSATSKLIYNSTYTTVFTGAGISVESGIPPFRGEKGIWNKFDSKFLDIQFFMENPEESWSVIREIFYDTILPVNPNDAHKFFSRLENNGLLHSVITQNIDDLHRRSGSYNIIELHGTVTRLTCVSCRLKSDFHEEIFNNLPPKCTNCGTFLKPDFIFFGEPLGETEISTALENSRKSDLMIVVGTSGEVYPASKIPFIAKESGAKIVEINPEQSNYTESITDIYLRGKAGEVCSKLSKLIFTGSRENN